MNVCLSVCMSVVCLLLLWPPKFRSPTLGLELLALPAAGQPPELPVRITDGDEPVPFDNVLVHSLGAIHPCLVVYRVVLTLLLMLMLL